MQRAQHTIDVPHSAGFPRGGGRHAILQRSINSRGTGGSHGTPDSVQRHDSVVESSVVEQ